MANEIVRNLNGYGLKSENETELRTRIEQAFIDVFSTDIDLSESSPQGQLISLFTEMFYSIQTSREGDWRARDLNTAVGFQLDIIGKEMHTPRLIAKKIKYKVRLSGYPEGLIIPANTKFYSLNNYNIVFQNISDFVFAATAYDMDVELNTPDLYQEINMGDVLQSKTQLSSTGNIEIISRYDLPQDFLTNESDDAYRRRLINAGGIYSDVKRLEQKLRDLPEVSKILIQDNKSQELVNEIPSHSCEIIILGGIKEDIGKVFLEWLPLGIITNQYQGNSGAISEQIIVTDSREVLHDEYYVTRPYSSQFDLRLQCSERPGKSLDVADIEKLQTLVTDYINRYNIGDLIILNDILDLIMREFGDLIFYNSLVMLIDGAAIQNAFYRLNIRQYVVARDIEVTII